MRAPPNWNEGISPDFVEIPRVSRSKNSHTLRPIDIKRYAELAGWYLSEGYCTRYKGVVTGRVVICQSDANPDFRVEIIALLRSLGIEPKTKTKDITFSCNDLAQHLIKTFGEGSANKTIPVHARNWKKEHLLILATAMLKGDGHKKDGFFSSLKSYSLSMRDSFQEIAIKLGWGASVDAYQNVNLTCKRAIPSIVTPPQQHSYEGYIGCCDVPNGLLIVRRNGKACVSGNSYESMYQCVKRSNRVGSTRPLNVHIPTTDIEEPMISTVLKKAKRIQADAEEQERIFRDESLEW